MRSPFKFLDAYSPQDRDIFFGRDEEIDTLYRMISENRLLLVYGQSGTGKTSLIQCGLAGRFDATDWYARFIRRNEDINRSLWQTLTEAAGFAPLDDFGERVEKIYEKSEGVLLLSSPSSATNFSMENPSSLPAAEAPANVALLAQLSAGVVEMVEEIYANYLRPVYLIFDQLEELFILGHTSEKAIFIHLIKAIFAAKLPCRIIFILREEYIAHLYEFEKVIPTLFDRRLRVEPMSYQNVSQVIRQSCERFKIELEEPTENVQQIIDNISAGKSGIQLPYLQVYLDMLYREDFARTYPELANTEKDSHKLLPLTFTRQEIDEFGKIEDVLVKFLQEQERAIQLQLEAKYPAMEVGAVRQLLDVFVTEEGTKRPIRYELLNEQIQLEQTIHQRFVHWPAEALSLCLRHLENARLLRAGENTLELAHDSLAALIDQERSDEQRQLNEVKSRITNAHREFLQTGEYLSRKQLGSMELFIPRLNLKAELAQFLRDSQAEADRLEQAELEKQRKELKKERALRAEAEKSQQQAEKNARRARIFSFLAVVVTIGAIFAALLALKQNSRTHLLTGDSYLRDEQFPEALTSYRAASSFSFWNKEEILEKIDKVARLKNTAEQYRSLIAAGDSLLAQGPAHYRESMKRYQQAEALDYPYGDVKPKIQNLAAVIDRQFIIFVEKGKTFDAAGGKEEARYAFGIADALKPGADPYVTNKLKELK